MILPGSIVQLFFVVWIPSFFSTLVVRKIMTHIMEKQGGWRPSDCEAYAIRVSLQTPNGFVGRLSFYFFVSQFMG